MLLKAMPKLFGVTSLFGGVGLFGVLLGSFCLLAQDLPPTPDPVPPTVEAPTDLASPADLAAPAEEKSADDSPRIIRDRTFYVPFRKIEEVFEKTGRGVFLAYDEFIALWKRAEENGGTAAVRPLPTTVSGGEYHGSIAGELARFEVSFDVETFARGWSRIPLGLEGVAIESVTVSDPEALFIRAGDAYELQVPAPGNYTLTIAFAVRVSSSAGKKSFRFRVPALARSRLDVLIPEPEARVEVTSFLAATERSREADGTRLVAYLGTERDVEVTWTPPPGRASEDGAIVVGEQRLRLDLRERVLRIDADIRYQVLRGETDTFRLRMPENTLPLRVEGANIREWSPKDGVLTVVTHEPVSGQYAIQARFERLLDQTPETLSMPFPRLLDVLRESGGWVALSHEPGLSVRVTSQTNLSQLDPDEVPNELREGTVVAYRYLAQPVALALAIEKITPVVDGAVVSLVAVGPQEDVHVGWIDYDIRKAGVFELRFQVPTGWTLSEVGDSSTVEEFQATTEGDLQTVTVSLRAKAFGGYRLPFQLTRTGTGKAGTQTLAPPRLLGVQQERGLFGVSVPRSLELETTGRTGLVDIDADELLRTGIASRLPDRVPLPRAYRYRTSPSFATIALTQKKSEAQVLVQHLVEVEDGELRFTHFLDYDVQFAPVDSLFFSAPSSLDGALQVVSEPKGEVTSTAAGDGRTRWEIKLPSPTIGGVSVTVRHSQELGTLAAGTPRAFPVPLIRPERTESVRGFVALRKLGSLEIEAEAGEMEAIDPGNLPDKLRRGKVYGAYRYLATNPSLVANLTRYEYETLATAAVSLLHLKSVISEKGQLRTQATLFVKNAERPALELALPADARVLSLSVAGRRQAPKQRDGRWIIDIPRSAGPQAIFPVALVFEHGVARLGSWGSVRVNPITVLDDVPVSRVEADFYTPPDYRYTEFRGSLTRPERGAGDEWQRFKVLAASPSPRERSGSASRFPLDGHIDVDVAVPEPFLRHRLEGLSGRTDFEFGYMDQSLFRGLDFLVFLGVSLGLAIAIRRREELRWTIAIGAVTGSLLLAALSTGLAREVIGSALTGALAVGAVLLVRSAWTSWRESRARRIDLAPDPYLEEAESGKGGVASASDPGASDAAESASDDPEDNAPSDDSTPKEDR